ncbi:MAG: 3-isopropylmalate dehydratase small subunit [Acidobacteriota bacterium]|nr:3-isopropylmalate dehydratase small subunit [Acidobacteriota bacterium]
MQPMRIHRGQAIPLGQANIDTDQIIPKQFLKRIERTGYGPFLFNDWRYASDGQPKPEFVINREPYKHGTILIAGKNFGCGSSREHAAWALTNFGILVVIAPSFADIFHSNAANNGLLTVALPEEKVTELLAKAESREKYELTIDVEKLTVSDAEGWSANFPLDSFRQHCLLNGLDQISLTLQRAAAIQAFEDRPKPY